MNNTPYPYYNCSVTTHSIETKSVNSVIIGNSCIVKSVAQWSVTKAQWLTSMPPLTTIGGIWRLYESYE